MKKTKPVSWHLPLSALIKLLMVLGILVFMSCQTAGPAKAPEPSGEEPKVSEKAEPNDDSAESEAVSEAEPETADDDSYEVSEEVYERTFTEIEELIDNLNETIRNKDFEGWKDKLTQEYIETMSSPENLQRISEKPAIKDSGLDVDSLRSYFLNVVVPSRANSRVDEIVFVNDNRIKAFMVINGQKTILYRLVKVDGQWKIGTSE